MLKSFIGGIMKLHVASLLCAVAVASLSAHVHADATPIAPLTVQGRIDELTYGPDGRPDGIVLKDHTVAIFRPELFTEVERPNKGDMISLSGIQTRSSPNRVFEKIVLRKGTHVIVDDSQSSPIPPPVIPAQIVNFRATDRSSDLFAVGTRPDGQIDRLILKDGTTIQIPGNAYVDPAGLRLGEKISVHGAGLSFGDGRFIRAFDVFANGRQLLVARSESGEKWMNKKGTVQQLLLTPQGDIDGVLLKDKAVIRFHPIPIDQAAKLKPGVRVATAGPAIRNQVRANTLIFPKDETVLSLGPESLVRGGILAPPGSEQEPPPPNRSLTPLQDHAKIQVVLHTPRGDLDALVLSDGVTVKVPPHTRMILKSDVKAGDPVKISGRGGKYAVGTAIEADSIHVVAG
jgi:hypothetical protein